MKKPENIYTQAAKYLADEMTPEEKSEFQKLLLTDTTVESEFNEMRKTWKSFENAGGKFRNTGPAWNKLMDRLEEDGLASRSLPRNHPFAWQLIRVAALALVFLVTGFILRQLTDKGSETFSELTYSAAAQSTAFELPDGSMVFLNKNSSLDLDPGFPSNRFLSLSGEAFFEVMADSARPFTVMAGNSRVVVRGTRFNLKQSATGTGSELFVEAGRVDFSNEAEDKVISLIGGQFAVSDGNAVRFTQVPDPNYLSWKTKVFFFTNEPLGQALRVLSDAYHVTIQTQGINPEEMRLTATYNKQTVEAVVETICTLYDLKCTREDDAFILSGNIN
jgi:ferric-dicitrate binding protein FerR (iron transport regulator)